MFEKKKIKTDSGKWHTGKMSAEEFRSYENTRLQADFFGKTFILPSRAEETGIYFKKNHLK